jgi:hypothetical protein
MNSKVLERIIQNNRHEKCSDSKNKNKNKKIIKNKIKARIKEKIRRKGTFITSKHRISGDVFSLISD